ncbi:MAG: 50S ribosomal protein L25 [Bacteroidota bacterium]
MANATYTPMEGVVRELDKKNTQALRDDKKVPAVLYGPEVKDNVFFSVDELELEKVLSRKQTKLVELTVDGTVYKTLLKRTEFDPITDRPLHADFYVLSSEHKVTLRVPIVLSGSSRGVLDQGGRLFQPMKVVRIRVLPEYIPEEFKVDVTPLKVGNSLHVSDLNLEGIVPIDPLNRTIVTIRPPKGALAADFMEDDEEETEENATEE